MAAISNERNSPNPDQILVGLLRDAREGDTFERIPEHVTLLHWFSLNAKYQGAFENALMNIAHDAAPLELVGEGRKGFGPDKKIPVTTLRLGALATFHKSVLEAVQRLDGRVHSEYIGDNYAPHISDTTSFKYEVGQEHLLEQIQLISVDRETQTRKIEKVIALTGGTHGAPTARF